MAWHGRPLRRTELYSTVPMLSLGTGGAALHFLWIGSCLEGERVSYFLLLCANT